MEDSNAEYFLGRAKVILRSMVQENKREWWEFWVPRWTIDDESLRNDARNLLVDISDWEERRRDVR
jgi:hypothetical protein